MSARWSVVILLLVVFAAGPLLGEPADQNLKIAKDLLKKQRFPEAIEVLTKAISADPAVPEYYTKRAEAYVGAGKPADAVVDLTKAIELDPQDRDLYFERSKAYESQSMIKEAILDCTRALAIKRDFAIQRQRALLYEKIGQLDAALNDYSDVLKSQPFRADLYIMRGRLYRLTGQAQRAAEDFGRAIRLNPAYNIQVTRVLSETASDKPVVVRPSLANIVPDAKPVMGEIGAGAAEGKPATAKAPVKQAAPEIASRPDLVVVVKGKKEKDKKPKAEEMAAAAKATARRPEMQEPLGLPQIRHEARVETIETTTVRRPQQVTVGATSAPSEPLKSAERSTNENYQNTPQNQAVNSALQKGRSQLDAKQYPDAIASFTAVIEARPKQCDAYVRRCMAYYLSGDLKSAQADCDKALEINPREADAHYYRGRILQSGQTFGPAIDEYTAAISLKPYFPDAFFYRAQASAAMDNLSAAIYNYSEAARQKQGFAEALQARADIKLQLGDKLGYDRDVATLKGIKK